MTCSEVSFCPSDGPKLKVTKQKIWDVEIRKCWFVFSLFLIKKKKEFSVSPQCRPCYCQTALTTLLMKKRCSPWNILLGSLFKFRSQSFCLFGGSFSEQLMVCFWMSLPRYPNSVTGVTSVCTSFWSLVCSCRSFLCLFDHSNHRLTAENPDVADCRRVTRKASRTVLEDSQTSRSGRFSVRHRRQPDVFEFLEDVLSLSHEMVQRWNLRYNIQNSSCRLTLPPSLPAEQQADTFRPAVLKPRQIRSDVTRRTTNHSEIWICESVQDEQLWRFDEHDVNDVTVTLTHNSRRNIRTFL